MDAGQRIDAVRRRLGPAVKVADDGHESAERIGDANERFAVENEASRDDGGGGGYRQLGNRGVSSSMKVISPATASSTGRAA